MSAARHRGHSLAKIEKNEDWAGTDLTQRLTQTLHFHTFYTMLGSSITQKAISDGDISGNSSKTNNDTTAYGTHFGEQYARRNAHIRTTYRRRPPHKRKFAELQELIKKTWCL